MTKEPPIDDIETTAQRAAVPGAEPHLSIAICTRNRAAILPDALESVGIAIEQAHSPVELIVVDNGSTDDTARVVERFERVLPLVSVFEVRPGLCIARNSAVEVARGEYIVWTDDDVLVDPTWISAYESAIAEHPEASFFGGPIQPRFEGQPPTWLTSAWREVESTYAARDLGSAVFQIESLEQLPFGANFAIRMREQRTLRYDPRLGRQPENPWLCGDETDVLLRVLEDGGEGWWIPAAAVHHRIPPVRQTLRSLVGYGFGLGQSLAMTEPAPAGLRLLGRPLPLWTRCAWELARAAANGLMRGPKIWVPAVREASIAAGRLRGTGRQ